MKFYLPHLDNKLVVDHEVVELTSAVTDFPEPGFADRVLIFHGLNMEVDFVDDFGRLVRASSKVTDKSYS
ncbi:MAG: hypothetical protein R3E08_10725 [Thiotrichaceae bacterium]